MSQTAGGWRSYVYDVPMPRSGQVYLTPGNQPTATLSASKSHVNHAATIYYANCGEGFSVCSKGGGWISSIEYFRDEDLGTAGGF
jgi:hypothetical protein